MTPTDRGSGRSNEEAGDSRKDRSGERSADPRAGKKIRYAVGLGYISQSAVLPAFAKAKENSKLTALVEITRRPEMSQEISKPSPKLPQLVKAAAPGVH